MCGVWDVCILGLDEMGVFFLKCVSEMVCVVCFFCGSNFKVKWCVL